MDDITTEIFAFFVELAGIRELTEFFARLDALDESVKTAFSVIGLLICFVGLLQCFLGYKLFRFWCSVVGLLVGFLFGTALATSGILSVLPDTTRELIGILLIVLLSITGACIAYSAYLVGVFLYAFSVGFFVLFFVLALFTSSILACFIAGMLAGLAMGIISIMYRRILIIAATSISGGMSIMIGLMMVMQTINISYGFILPPVFMVAGFFVQNATVKKVAAKSGSPITIVVPPGQPAGSSSADPAVTTPADTTEAPPADTAEAPPADTAEAPPADTAEAPPADTAEAPPADTAEAPPAKPPEAT